MTTETHIAATGLTGLVGRHLTRITNSHIHWESFGGREDGRNVTSENDVMRWLESSSASIVLHLAAFTDVTAAWGQSGDQSEPCYQINVHGSRNIARACAATGKYLIHVSSDYVFSGDSDRAYTEQDHPDAVDWYGRTKQLAEAEVVDAGCHASIVRLSHPFGTCPAPNRKDMVWKIVSNLRRQVPMSLFGDTVITPTLIDDFAQIVTTLAYSRQRGVFHATGSTNISPFALGQQVATATGLDARVIRPSRYDEYVTSPNARPYPRHLAVDNSKTVNELGVEMRTLDEALKQLDASAFQNPHDQVAVRTSR